MRCPHWPLERFLSRNASPEDLRTWAQLPG